MKTAMEMWKKTERAKGKSMRYLEEECLPILERMMERDADMGQDKIFICEGEAPWEDPSWKGSKIKNPNFCGTEPPIWPGTPLFREAVVSKLEAYGYKARLLTSGLEISWRKHEETQDKNTEA